MTEVESGLATSQSSQNLAGYPGGFLAGLEAVAILNFFQIPTVIRSTIRPETGQIQGWIPAKCFPRGFHFKCSKFSIFGTIFEKL